MRVRLFLAVMAWATTAPAVTRHVPAEYSTIQSALDVSAAGDTVLVAPGTYTDSKTRVQIGGSEWTSCAFMVDGVVLRSEGGPTVTVIDMQQASGPQPHVVLARYQLSGQSVIEGFTITGARVGGRGAYTAFGNLVTFRNCVFRDMNVGNSTGAGIASNGDLLVDGCEFVNCVTTNGGGAIAHGSGRLEMFDCSIRQCGGIGVLMFGILGDSFQLEGCTFENCWASSGGSAAFGAGNQQVGAVLRGCRFISNVGAGPTGAVGVAGFQTTILVEGCLFWNNRGGQGAGLRVSGPSIVRGNTFYGNVGSFNSGGGAVAFTLTGSPGELSHNIFVANQSNGGAVYAYNVPLNTSCNVFWQNAPGNHYTPGPTDRIIDPLLCDPTTGDFRLMVGSPCLPGDPLGCGLIGAFDQGCGTISISPMTWGQVKGVYRVKGTP